MKNIFNLVFAAIIFIFLVSIADASPITSITESYTGPFDYNKFKNEGNVIDHGNAPGYGDAKNTMGVWQRLGAPGYNDDGVSWSVNNSDYGTTASLIQGMDVTFKFELWQSNTGKHNYDQIISFLDWDQSKSWESTEKLIYQKVYTTIVQTNNDYQTDETYIKENDTLTTIYYTLTVADDAMLGDTWLRTRVHCNETTYPNITAYNDLYQGETLDVKLTIEAAPVPEPATMLLFGTGLLGLAGIKRRKNK